ncbi:head maturation protease, ClpP-related [Staphylococcus saprophyticus]|uniref:head maturation protease, ClpP-related n=1 Tax=Staphylococcus saprophyticus TaxID=29385 RepID=UPI0009BBA6ED|nr:head maturation protease, ClpP-related [Staphylococcus saprophyticus]AUY63144.1 Clp protease ClpP [Staphylococcus saprophyticus]MDW3837893.1 Clp protease ClpP [Staphylococcus saprophyticus]MDW4061919.1 Clp protease ClpP [Staphylococcus saprophyticus]MDW4104014.1 Clp protease ClpP [Staphylococcus saprophyticus]MDW4205100.1 Clp protease ClpP [Staphylococcus saprophyticus]
MKINVKGAIVPNNDKWIYDMLEMDATSPKDVFDALSSTDDDVEVIINSGGGDVFSGSEIYTALKEHQGNVNVKVVGVAASAASVIAMAGSKIEMSPTAQMMIHNASSIAVGDNREMQTAYNMLTSANKAVANAYIAKTGKSEQEITDLMNEETWFSADTAVEQGFADSKMFDESAPRLVANSGQMLSNDAVSRIATLMSKTPEVNIDVEQIANKVIEKLEDKKEPFIDNSTKSKSVEKNKTRFFF